MTARRRWSSTASPRRSRRCCRATTRSASTRCTTWSGSPRAAAPLRRVGRGRHARRARSDRHRSHHARRVRARCRRVQRPRDAGERCRLLARGDGRDDRVPPLPVSAHLDANGDAGDRRLVVRGLDVCADIQLYGPFLGDLGLCNPDTGLLLVSGGLKIRAFGDGVAHAPAGRVGSVAFATAPMDVTATLTGSALVATSHTSASCSSMPRPASRSRWTTASRPR